MANHSSILALKTHEQHEEAKRYDTRRRAPPGWKVPSMLLGNSFRMNKESGPKWKSSSAVDMPGGEGRVRCCKEQCCIGTWEVRSMNQGNWMWSGRRW